MPFGTTEQLVEEVTESAALEPLTKVPQPCKGTSVVVKIVDYCPAGCQGTIDLSQEAFAAIANPDAGKIQIEYNQV